MRILILIVVFILSGCANMSPAEKRTAWIIAGVAAGAVVAGSSSGDSKSNHCKPTVGGSGADFDFYCR